MVGQPGGAGGLVDRAGGKGKGALDGLPFRGDEAPSVGLQKQGGAHKPRALVAVFERAPPRRNFALAKTASLARLTFMLHEELEVGAFAAKNRLSELVDRAARGARIWITKRGRRVALLSSGSDSPSPAKESLVERFGRIRGRAKPGTQTLKELVEEGRR